MALEKVTVPVSVCKKRAVPALIPALASLVMIAVEKSQLLPSEEAK